MRTSNGFKIPDSIIPCSMFKCQTMERNQMIFFLTLCQNRESLIGKGGGDGDGDGDGDGGNEGLTASKKTDQNENKNKNWNARHRCFLVS